MLLFLVAVYCCYLLLLLIVAAASVAAASVAAASVAAASVLCECIPFKETFCLNFVFVWFWNWLGCVWDRWDRWGLWGLWGVWGCWDRWDRWDRLTVPSLLFFRGKSSFHGFVILPTSSNSNFDCFNQQTRKLGPNFSCTEPHKPTQQQQQQQQQQQRRNSSR